MKTNVKLFAFLAVVAIGAAAVPMRVQAQLGGIGPSGGHIGVSANHRSPQGHGQQIAIFQLQQAGQHFIKLVDISEPRDSEQFQALTNILKAKLDAAVAAIQNTR